MNRILLVGELNPYGSDPEYALYPLPERASGNRLRQILGLSLSKYLHDHDRCNLCDGRWSSTVARGAALRLLEERPASTGLVLCGSKVAFAFRVEFGGPLRQVVTERGLRLLSVPHPSGLNRMWNDPALASLVRAAYQQLALDVAQVELPEGADVG